MKPWHPSACVWHPFKNIPRLQISFTKGIYRLLIRKKNARHAEPQNKHQKKGTMILVDLFKWPFIFGILGVLSRTFNQKTWEKPINKKNHWWNNARTAMMVSIHHAFTSPQTATWNDEGWCSEVCVAACEGDSAGHNGQGWSVSEVNSHGGSAIQVYGTSCKFRRFLNLSTGGIFFVRNASCFKVVSSLFWNWVPNDGAKEP